MNYVAALAKFEVTQEDLDRAPQITTVLENAAGGLDEVLAAMRFSTHPLIIEFLKEYDQASKIDHEILPWEIYAIHAKIDATLLLGAIILCLQQASANLVKVIAISHHPEVMRARVRAAKTLGGVKDRNAIDTGLGFLPKQKGMTIVNVQRGGGEGELEESDEDGEVDEDILFPALSRTQKMLAAPKR